MRQTRLSAKEALGRCLSHEALEQLNHLSDDEDTEAPSDARRAATWGLAWGLCWRSCDPESQGYTQSWFNWRKYCAMLHTSVYNPLFFSPFIASVLPSFCVCVSLTLSFLIKTVCYLHDQKNLIGCGKECAHCLQGEPKSKCKKEKVRDHLTDQEK